MPRQWKVWDDWSGGGFFAGGSYSARERYNALNMQRYSNGAIGPRPGWRKLTQSDFGTGDDVVPSVSNANRSTLQQGAYYAPFGDYVVLISSTSSTTASKRISLSGAAGTAVYRVATGALGYHTATAADLRNPYSALQTNAVVAATDSVQQAIIGGLNYYNASTDTRTTATQRVITGTGVTYYPTYSTYHRGRVYGWENLTDSYRGYVVYTDVNFTNDYNSGDGGEFRLSGATIGGATTAVHIPHGLWSVNGSLLVFATGGGATSTTPNYTGITTAVDEYGQWFTLSGASPTSGTLTALGRDIGPLLYSLSIVNDGSLMFPIERRGWCVHDGAKLDKNSLADLRPGRGQYVDTAMWLNPVKTTKKTALVLPYNITESDPTATTATYDEIGEFWAKGYGGFEYVNGAWTENLYLHGQSDIIAHGQFNNDKLFALHLDSSDSGTNWFPRIYSRDTTLDRPATTSSQNTYNRYSDGTETAPTQAGAATGDMVCRLETGEFHTGGFSSLEPEAVVIDYDYWNSSLFHGSTCGFSVSLIIRSITNNEREEILLTPAPVSPPNTSSGVIPNRARVTVNMPARYRNVGSAQVKISGVVDCAIYSIALGYQAQDPSSQVR